MTVIESHSLVVRPALENEDDFLFRVFASTRDESLGLGDWEADRKDTLLRMQFSLRQQHYERYFGDADTSIVFQDDEPIGSLICQLGPDHFRLVDIALLPPFRGCGIGRRLINDLLERAREAGKPCRLQVERSNPAMRLYARLGFQLLSESEIYAEMEWSPA